MWVPGQAFINPGACSWQAELPSCLLRLLLVEEYFSLLLVQEEMMAVVASPL